MFVAGARTRPAASLPTRLEHREYLATVAAAERHRCLPSAWGAAASGLGGHISGAAHAVAAASAVDAAAAAKTGLECTDAHRPLGAARRGFRQTTLLLRPDASWRLPCRSHRQVHRAGLCRATPLGISVAAERPARARERQPWQRQGVCTCMISGTRRGQTSVGALHALCIVA